MRRMLRRLAIALAVLAVGVAAWFGYLFHQATRLPEWYDADAIAVEDPEEVDVGWVVVPDEEAAPAGEAPKSAVAPKKRRRELRNFHLRSAAGNSATRKAVRASRAVYEDGRIEAGVVISVKEIDLDKLQKKDREFYRRALEAFPALERRDVYVGIEDEPSSKDGYLQLGPRTKVRIGDLRYSLAKVARKLGIEQSKVRKQINREFVRLKVTDPQAPAPPDDDADGL